MFEDFFEKNRSAMLSDLARLIAIPSVKSEPEQNAPFGRACARALEEAEAICVEKGLFTQNVDNYVVTADLNNFQPGMDILVHLDVVPPGEGWNHEPFSLTEENGILYGRGVSDDKGPAIAAIYALAAVKQAGIALGKNVRLILGSDEECGSSDLTYYFQNHTSAPYSFSPDADFPVINTEKGRYSPNFFAEYQQSSALPRIDSVHCGTASNAVSQTAIATIAGMDREELQVYCEVVQKYTGVRFLVEPKNDTLLITASGTSAHASLPEAGNNPLTALLLLIAVLPLPKTQGHQLLRALQKMFPHRDVNGKALNLCFRDEISGIVTIALTILHYEDGHISGCFDSRIPLCGNEENFFHPINKAFEEKGFRIDSSEKMVPPHHVSPSLPFVQTLLEVYEANTGLKGECLAVGGGTYVHDIENGVAFGCTMPGYDTRMHGTDERIPFQDLITSAKIFAEVIAKICL